MAILTAVSGVLYKNRPHVSSKTQSVSMAFWPKSSSSDLTHAKVDEKGKTLNLVSSPMNLAFLTRLSSLCREVFALSSANSSSSCLTRLGPTSRWTLVRLAHTLEKWGSKSSLCLGHEKSSFVTRFLTLRRPR